MQGDLAARSGGVGNAAAPEPARDTGNLSAVCRRRVVEASQEINRIADSVTHASLGRESRCRTTRLPSSPAIGSRVRQT